MSFIYLFVYLFILLLIYLVFFFTISTFSCWDSLWRAKKEFHRTKRHKKHFESWLAKSSCTDTNCPLEGTKKFIFNCNVSVKLLLVLNFIHKLYLDNMSSFVSYLHDHKKK